MRWLVLTDDFPPLDGGVATFAHAAASGLGERGHEVIVATRARAGLVPGPYTLRAVSGPAFGRYGSTWLTLNSLWHGLRVDRVLATTWGVAVGMVPWLARRGIPLEVVYHGSDVTREPRDPAAFARVAAYARRWVVSDYLGERLGARGWTAEWLPAPLDPLPLGSGGQGWVFVGRATRLKGGDRFIALCAAAGVRGMVFGDGPELVAWKALAGLLRADVTFRGRVARPALLAELGSFDRVFLLSRPDVRGDGAEGLGYTLLEGGLAGVPGIGSATGGIPEAAGLVLADPDDIDASLARIRAWDPAREAVREVVAARHGVARTLQKLTGDYSASETSSSSLNSGSAKTQDATSPSSSGVKLSI